MRANLFFVVVHTQDAAQALRNTRIALDNGADGVFLINHAISAMSLRRIFDEVRQVNPKAWLGVNILAGFHDLIRHSRDYLPFGMRALWCDSVGFREEASDEHAIVGAEDINSRLVAHPDEPKLFAGISFKYQKETEDIPRAIRLLSPYVDVFTTSGPKTGEPPTLEKIESLRQALGDKTLAVASGMTPENVDPFLPLVDCFLVATGVSKSFIELDPKLVRAFSDKMNR